MSLDGVCEVPNASNENLRIGVPKVMVDADHPGIEFHLPDGQVVYGVINDDCSITITADKGLLVVLPRSDGVVRVTPPALSHRTARKLIHRTLLKPRPEGHHALRAPNGHFHGEPYERWTTYQGASSF